jgi:hypothetical protein
MQRESERLNFSARFIRNKAGWNAKSRAVGRSVVPVCPWTSISPSATSLLTRWQVDRFRFKEMEPHGDRIFTPQTWLYGFGQYCFGRRDWFPSMLARPKI